MQRPSLVYMLLLGFVSILLRLLKDLSILGPDRDQGNSARLFLHSQFMAVTKVSLANKWKNHCSRRLCAALEIWRPSMIRSPIRGVLSGVQLCEPVCSMLNHFRIRLLAWLSLPALCNGPTLHPKCGGFLVMYPGSPNGASRRAGRRKGLPV